MGASVQQRVVMGHHSTLALVYPFCIMHTIVRPIAQNCTSADAVSSGKAVHSREYKRLSRGAQDA